MKHLVRLAYEICATAHAGQTDKAGMPYHLHTERVASRCSTDAEAIVALLHDTLTDKDVSRLRKYLKAYHFLKED